MRKKIKDDFMQFFNDFHTSFYAGGSKVYESSHHLFLECSFFGKVWSNVLIWSDVSCALSNNNFLHAIHV